MPGHAVGATAGLPVLRRAPQRPDQVLRTGGAEPFQQAVPGHDQGVVGRFHGFGIDHQQAGIDEALQHLLDACLLLGLGNLEFGPGDAPPGHARAVLFDHAQEHALDRRLQRRAARVVQRTGASVQRPDHAAGGQVVLARQRAIVRPRRAPTQLRAAIHLGQREGQHRQCPGHGHDFVDQFADQRLRLEVQRLVRGRPLDALAELLAAEGRNHDPRLLPEIGQCGAAARLRLEIRAQRQHHRDRSLDEGADLLQDLVAQLRIAALRVQLLELIDQQQPAALDSVEPGRGATQFGARVAAQPRRVHHRPVADRGDLPLRRILQPRQHAGLDDAGLAGARGADHGHQVRPVDRDDAIEDLGNTVVAAEQQLGLIRPIRPQPHPRVVGLVQRRIGNGVGRPARVAEDVLTAVVRPQRPDAGGLQRRDVGAAEFLQRVLEQLGRGDHSVRRVAAARRIGLAGQTPDQRQRERRMAAGRVVAVAGVGIAWRNVQRRLVVRGRGQHLPGGAAQKALVLAVVERPPVEQQVAGRGPAEGACEAAVENDQQVLAGQGLERLAQAIHRQPGLLVAEHGVGAQQVALRPFGAVAQGHAVTGEIQQEVGDGAGVGHGTAQGPNSAPVGIDADDQRGAVQRSRGRFRQRRGVGHGGSASTSRSKRSTPRSAARSGSDSISGRYCGSPATASSSACRLRSTSPASSATRAR